MSRRRIPRFAGGRYPESFQLSCFLSYSKILEQVRVLSDPEGEDFDIGVQRPQLTINALKKGLLIACNTVHRLSGVNHFMRLKHEMKAVTAPYMEVKKNMQRAKQSRITSSPTKQCVLPPPCTLNHFITPTCLRKDNQCHSSKHKHKMFLVHSSLIYVLSHFMYL